MKKTDHVMLTSQLLSKILISFINRRCEKFRHADQSIVRISLCFGTPRKFQKMRLSAQ